jgi:FdhD protein
MMTRFAQTQDVFHCTGGLHAAALFNADGEHLITREDIGRHNAVDKVIGWAYREGYRTLEETILLVSGRVSFEIVQKALVAQIPILAAVSAPSSLAVQLAEQSNQTLLGFVRGDSLNIYSRPERISLG